MSGETSGDDLDETDLDPTADTAGSAAGAFDAQAQAAWREELERLAEMGTALARFAERSQQAKGTLDAAELAALQDKNLEGYADMVTEAGAAAFAKAQELARQMSEALDSAGGGDAAPLDGVEIALAEIKATRDARAAAFLDALSARMGNDDPDALEPFE